MTTFTKDDVAAMMGRIAGNKPSAVLGEVVKVRAKGKTTPRPRTMNKVEARYSLYLEKEKAAGRISAFWFEAWKIRLSDTCTWTPDFVVIDCDGMIEWRDTKAWWAKANKVGIEEDSLVKMKTAAEMYPQFKVLATWERDGVWEQRVF